MLAGWHNTADIPDMHFVHYCTAEGRKEGREVEGGMEEGRKEGRKEGREGGKRKEGREGERKEMFYLMTHSTHFIYDYMDGRKCFI